MSFNNSLEAFLLYCQVNITVPWFYGAFSAVESQGFPLMAEDKQLPHFVPEEMDAQVRSLP